MVLLALIVAVVGSTIIGNIIDNKSIKIGEISALRNSAVLSNITASQVANNTYFVKLSRRCTPVAIFDSWS
jgi:hypothetical protein